MAEPTTRGSIALAAALDAVALVVFAAVGRRTHDSSGSAVATTLHIAAPFLIAAAVGWLVGRVWREPFGWSAGVVVWVCAVAGGMALRHTVFDRGTALPFVIVASTFTMCALLGWRAVARWTIARRRSMAK
ncbi:MAG: DUF3054 domain-containing protein [Ilumatobacteraceae bacterium]